jgi:tRNA-splicing ligase RtcB (3'-phosphate/5'-hydroxy nucleic acid ligase)
MAIAAKLSHNRVLEDRDLSVFLAGTPEFAAYRRDLFWAQEYAALNRRVMLEQIQLVLREHFPGLEFDESVACHHNYVAEERHYGEDLLVTRKGAIRAGAGELGIVPGSMGAKSYIVRGRGNALSFESASHGAGRRLSRTQARRAFSLSDLERQTRGVECRKDNGVLDEAPKAYKDIDRVMEQQQDLVEIVHELKQVVCVKG